MMQRTLRAVFEDGVLRPLDRLALPEHQEVQITVTVPAVEEVPTPAAWADLTHLVTSLNDNEIAARLSALKNAALSRQAQLASRSGVPFSSSTDLIEEVRREQDERF